MAKAAKRERVPAKKRAVLIGINDYLQIGDLRGCVNDVLNLRQILMRYYDFKVEDISVVTDSSATKERIVNRMAWLMDGAGPGDQLVLHFSGHGSTIRDFDGPESEELRPGLRNVADELICLFGMDWRDRDSYLIDDEIAELLRGLPKGAKMTVILDCCHSGTGTRAVSPPPPNLAPPPMPSPRGRAPRGGWDFGPAARGGWDYGGSGAGGWDYGGSDGGGWGFNAWNRAAGAVPQVARYLPPPPDIACRIDETNPVARRKIARASNGDDMNHILLAGCRDDQTSADAYIGGAYNGAFSFHLCRIVREAGGNISFNQLMNRIRQDLYAGGFEQVPQLEGPEVEKARQFLG